MSDRDQIDALKATLAQQYPEPVAMPEPETPTPPEKTLVYVSMSHPDQVEPFLAEFSALPFQMIGRTAFVEVDTEVAEELKNLLERKKQALSDVSFKHREHYLQSDWYEKDQAVKDQVPCFINLGTDIAQKVHALERQEQRNLTVLASAQRLADYSEEALVADVTDFVTQFWDGTSQVNAHQRSSSAGMPEVIARISQLVCKYTEGHCTEGVEKYLQTLQMKVINQYIDDFQGKMDAVGRVVDDHKQAVHRLGYLDFDKLTRGIKQLLAQEFVGLDQLTPKSLAGTYTQGEDELSPGQAEMEAAFNGFDEMAAGAYCEPFPSRANPLAAQGQPEPHERLLDAVIAYATVYHRHVHSETVKARLVEASRDLHAIDYARLRAALDPDIDLDNTPTP